MPFMIQHNVPLAPLHTFASPQIAENYYPIQSISDLKNLPRSGDRMILGGGSNVLFLRDYSGLMIHVLLKGIELIAETEQAVLIRVQAGESWPNLVAYTVEQKWWGLENLSLIPGTVGAAPVQNIGAYGVEVADCVDTVHAWDFKAQKNVSLQKNECDFHYRDSLFKSQQPNRYLITAVDFRLAKSAQPKLGYGPLQSLQNRSDLTPKDIADKVIEIRQAKLPDPSQIPNAGSFFTNPMVSIEQFEGLKQHHPNIVGFEYNHQIKLSAAWLIDQAGWKTRPSKEGIVVHKTQALVITNPQKAQGKAIKDYSDAIIDDIWQKYGVKLTPEVRFIG